jgi:DNA topoisomerase-1
MKNLVIVESPAKAKTINKYLGKDFEVLASFGHVRDLPSKDGSVRPDEDFAMTYEVDSDSTKHVQALAKAAKGKEIIYLATDPDREGEAISWHVLEALKERKALAKGTEVKRIAFNAITKSAVTDAIKHPRDIDMDLVNAQQARRALDYLVGFTLSPVLWRKLPGSKSAGRVQSVALRIICDREDEIEKFITEEYWDIAVQLAKSDKKTSVETRLTHWQGEKLQKFSITNEAQAKKIADALEKARFNVAEIEQKEVRRHPAPPFITSTLQQEASRKLGFSAKQTMGVAQKLYEAGLITYMRTDGITVSPEAVEEARRWIGGAHGKQYVPASPRMYKSKVKNAQEAHEAIRPTEVHKTPQAAGLSGEQFKLYELIWKRMVASQMESAVLDQVSVDFTSAAPQATLRATGTTIKFDGFMALYLEDKDDEEEDESSRILPPLNKGEVLDATKILPAQHFTQPPPRYSEASLVKKLEELGIGRPSTYAAILGVLIDRGYVLLDKKRFIPEARGRIVNAFLVSFFERYVQYDFTAQIEEKLDAVSAGEVDWKAMLREWWDLFNQTIQQAKEQPNQTVLQAVDALLESYLYGKQAEGADPRHCPKCAAGRLSLKTGKFGAFLGCSNYPECNYTKPIAADGGAEEGNQEALVEGPKNIGTDPETKLSIWLKKGPYGFYVQLGEDEKGTKPKRASLPKGATADSITLERALELLALPRDVGKHPESGKMIVAGLGRFGPYLLHDGKYTSIPAGDDVYTIGINRAVDVLASKKAPKGAEPLKNLGAHPDGGGDIQVFDGKYGAYVKHGKINATLPKGTTPESLTLEEALELIAAKGGAAHTKKGKATKKDPAKAKAAPRKTAKK